MNERLKRIMARLSELRTRWSELKEELPMLEERRDWADENASAAIWYHANVAVNETMREMKRIEKEVLELEKDRVDLEARIRRQNETGRR